jgi:CheY-like chemotaxis protein
MSSAKKVLLVDDSATALLLEQMALKGTPYQVLTATNGEEAVSVAGAEAPDLILLDVVMPKVDGLEALRRLRASPATRDTPVIMVTTRGDDESVSKARQLGCNDYVTKPVNGPDLLLKVRSFLEG